MIGYIIRRLLLLLLTLLGVSLIISSLTMLLPGDYVDVMLGTQQKLLTDSQVQALRNIYNLDNSWGVRYWRWIESIFQGSMGYSLRTGNSVLHEIISRFSVSLELALMATLSGAIIGIGFGVLSAIYRERTIEFVIRIVSLIGLSLPQFWLGMLIILGLSTYLNWMPPMSEVVSLFKYPLGNFKQFIFPTLTLAVALAATLMRITRSSMLEVLHEDYVRTARGKGLSERVVLFKHCLKNALIPVMTLAGMQMGYLLGGTVVVESVFYLPGLGTLLLNAVNHRDYPLIQGIVLVIAFGFAFINLVIDILYSLIDPQIRYN